MNKALLAASFAIVIGVTLMAAPYFSFYVLPAFQTEDIDPEGLTTQESDEIENEVAAPGPQRRSVVWEVPPATQDVIVEIYNEDNSYQTQYTITNYITLRPGQKIKVVAR